MIWFILIYLFIGCLLTYFLELDEIWDTGNCLFFIVTWPFCLIYAYFS